MASFASIRHHGWRTQAAWTKIHIPSSYVKIWGPRINQLPGWKEMHEKRYREEERGGKSVKTMPASLPRSRRPINSSESLLVVVSNAMSPSLFSILCHIYPFASWRVNYVQQRSFGVLSAAARICFLPPQDCWGKWTKCNRFCDPARKWADIEWFLLICLQN